ncbi:hypothetical protein H6F89_28405 [Cyanobacteria bacterium FACHB-63]|nr:hypothetical protein [Cyanobacteria bacterium FACHB-63]
MALRVGAFALSLGLLWRIPKTGIQHPAKPWAIVVLCIMALELFWHPYHSSTLAAMAQCLMYLAVLAPLFWVSRLEISDHDFRGLIYLLWGFHTLSSIVGVLQVYYPDIFNFAVSSVIRESTYGGDHLRITLANGLYIYRPSGLSDVPGNAANSGFYALLFGMGIALQERNLIFRLAGIASVPIGLFCIYLSQVRSTLILALVCLLVIALILIQLRRFWQVAVMSAITIALATVTTRWAVDVGGEMTSDRFLALIADSPDKVVYDNRGSFLEHTITEYLPQYPFGAGLGRWGMMNDYFGNNSNPMTPPLWAEIQWTGWLLDGGIMLVIAYAGAIIAACFGTWQVVSNRQSSLQLWGAIVFAYNVGAIVIIFNSPLFIGQGGMEFWLLNTALFVAAQYFDRHPVVVSWSKK